MGKFVIRRKSGNNNFFELDGPIKKDQSTTTDSSDPKKTLDSCSLQLVDL